MNTIKKKQDPYLNHAVVRICMKGGDDSKDDSF